MAFVVGSVVRPPLAAPESAEPPVDTTGPQDPSAPDASPGGPDPRGPLGRMPVAGLSRRSLAVVVGAIVVGWIVFVFARAVADSAASTDKAEILRQQTAVAATRLAAAERELEIIQSPDYLALQARAYGYGRAGERSFALMADAPSPRPITPLGAPPGSGGRSTPLDDWLDLLFGP